MNDVHGACDRRIQELEAENARLRAVVDAGIAIVASWRALQAVSERNDDSTGAAYEAWVAASDRLGAAVDQLDVSGVMGERTITPEELGNPDWYSYPDGPLGNAEADTSGLCVLLPGTPRYSIAAVRAHQAGIPVSLNHDTGDWVIPLDEVREHPDRHPLIDAMRRAMQEKAEWGETLIVQRDGVVVEVPASEILQNMQGASHAGDESSAGGATDG